MDANLYEKVQQTIIDALDQGEYVHVLGRNGNETDLKIQLYRLQNPEKETTFENCVADVNIPVGEVFTSPVLEGTDGVLNVSKVYLNELQYRDLKMTFQDGRLTDYSCSNFEDAEEGKKFIKGNVLHNHDTLPMGEFAIGTNTTAYVVARKYQIEDKFPILIAEKTGPHLQLVIPAIVGVKKIVCIIQMEKRLLQKTTPYLFCEKKMFPRHILIVTRILPFHMMSWEKSVLLRQMEREYQFC